MANGQVATSASGSVGRTIAVTLVGLALTTFTGQVQADAGQQVLLQGESATSAAGTLTPTPSTPLFSLEIGLRTGTLNPTGRSLVSTAQGTASPLSSLALQGLASQCLQGLVTPNAADSVPLLGTAITSATGLLEVPGSFALTGEESTAAAGTLTPVIAPDNSGGLEVGSAAGTITPSVSAPVEVTLSGVESITAQGDVGTLTSLAGSETTSEQGTATPSQDFALTGQAINSGIGRLGILQDPNDTYILSSAGFTTQSADVALTGEESTVDQGTVAVSNDIEAVLSGEASTSAAGSVGVAADLAVIGSESATGLYPFGAPGYGELSGQVITMGQGSVSLTPDRTESLSGLAITSADGSISVRPSSALSSQVLTGSTGSLGRTGGNMQQALSGASLTVAAGTFGVIGQDVIPPGVSTEGCGITTDTSAEGCSVTKAKSVEERTITSRPAREV